MTEYKELMEAIESNTECILYRLKNDIFDTVALIYNEGTNNEETYVLTDMQGAYPESLDEIEDYDWVRAEDINW